MGATLIRRSKMMSNEAIIEYFVEKYGNNVRPLILRALEFANVVEAEYQLEKPFNKVKYLDGLLEKRYNGKSEQGRY
jgi:hypothetical protein